MKIILQRNELFDGYRLYSFELVPGTSVYNTTFINRINQTFDARFDIGKGVFLDNLPFTADCNAVRNVILSHRQ